MIGNKEFSLSPILFGCSSRSQRGTRMLPVLNTLISR